MTITVDSKLVSLAAQFTNRYAPYHMVRIEPHRSGGALVMSTDRGAAIFIGYDPDALIEDSANLVVSKELATACNGVKNKTRLVEINDVTAIVTTYNKTSGSQAKELPVVHSQMEFPPVLGVVQAAIERWDVVPKLSETAGRYDTSLLLAALRAMAHEDSLCLSAFDGGPLRLQADDGSCLVLLAPQTATELPGVPPWLVSAVASG
jgi:hypothetical protein